MGSSAEVQQVQDSIAWGSIGFGAVALAAPGVFRGLYGLQGDGNVSAMIRLFGSRNLALGAIGLIDLDDDLRKQLNALTAAINVVDTVSILRAGPDVPLRARIGGAITTAGFAAASLWAYAQS